MGGFLRSFRIVSVFSASLRYRIAEVWLHNFLLHRTIDGTNIFLRVGGFLCSFRIVSVFSAALRYRISVPWLHNFLLP